MRLKACPSGPRERAEAERGLALQLGVPLASVGALLDDLPQMLPRLFHEAQEAEATIAELERLGVAAELQPIDGSAQSCVDHPRLWGRLECRGCGAPLCALCVAERAGLCLACEGKRARKTRFFRIRLSVLLVALVGVLLYAWSELRRRALRTDWSRPLRVAVVWVPAAPMEAGLRESLRARLPALEEQLAAEMAPHRPGLTPFSFVLGDAGDRGPGPPPQLGLEDDLWQELRFTWDLSAWAAACDDAAGLDASLFDARIYLVARPGDGQGLLMIEGIGQQGGDLGVVTLDLEASMIDPALFVVTHELFHILGASDKYAPDGSIIVPDGLGDPDQVPKYPQRGAEVMARHRAVGPGRSVPPESLAELRVGTATAREIRWLAP